MNEKKGLGIRIALGADRRNMLSLVLGQTWRIALYGTSIGIVLSIAVARLLGSTEYVIHPTDPAIFIGVAFLLVLVSFIASLLPALKAAQLDPVTALRQE